MRIAFTTLPLPSHTLAFLSIAKAVKLHNHEIVFLGFVDHEPMIRDAGFDFISVGEDQFPQGSIAAEFEPLSRLDGLPGIKYTYEVLERLCRSVLRDGEHALRRADVDALVTDTAMKGFEAIAITEGLPYVHVSATVHIDESGHTPIWSYSWPHETGSAAMERNRAGLQRFSEFSLPVRRALREYLDARQVAVDWSRPYSLLSPLAWLTQVPRELDFPSDHWPKQLKHVGPYFNPSVRPQVDFDWSRLTGEPLIYASLGTLQTGLREAYAAIARAAAAPGRQVVISVGSAAMVEKLKPLPYNVIALPFAPQIELIKRASLCITHAGLNTVLEALSFGVPLVAVPITNDQPGIAARIAHTGSGMFLPFEELHEVKLRKMINEVLEKPNYRRAAQRLEHAIRRAGGARRAAAEIHSAFSSIL